MRKGPGYSFPFRRSLRRFEAYRVSSPPHRIKLNQNESPVEWPASVRRRILSALAAESWARYPAFPPDRLARAIAAREGLTPKNVLVGHGSNELLYAVALAALEPRTSMILPSPSYGVAHLAAGLAGAAVRSVPLENDFTYSPERIVREALRVNARLLFLPSPNNPTGCSLSPEDVEQVAGGVRSLVVIDEAYREFGGACLTPLLARHSNLVLLRTFSKAWRLAGFRVGYLLGDERVLGLIEKGKPPHSVDVGAQIAAEIVLGESERMQKGVARIVRERRRMAAALRLLPGVRVYDSDANFLLVRVPDGERLFRRLLSAGVLVRFVGARAGRSGPSGGIPVDRRLQNCLRITVGRRADNDLLLATIREELGEKRG